MANERNELGEFGLSNDRTDSQPPFVEPLPPHGGGPKTPFGKARSSQNAIKHGLCAQAAIIEGEDPAELEAMHAEFLTDEKPQTAMERLLIERVVMAGWRLRRAGRYEQNLIRTKLATVRRQRAHNTKWGRVKDEQAEAELDLPRAIDLCLQGKGHAQMVRYENSLARELYKAIGELRKTQANRADSETGSDESRTQHRRGNRGAGQSQAVPSAPDSPVMVLPDGVRPPKDPTRKDVTWLRVSEPPTTLGPARR